jgi:(p)ppGpp synthase/HD superfamily hydrolase
MPGLLSPTIASELVQIGWLHDVIEDTPYTASDLTTEGFSNDVVMRVVALSKPDNGLLYLDWIRHLAANAPLPVILVKISDIEDNTDPERLALLDGSKRTHLEAKYGTALSILQAAAARLGWKTRGGDAETHRSSPSPLNCNTLRWL